MFKNIFLRQIGQRAIEYINGSIVEYLLKFIVLSMFFSVRGGGVGMVH